MKVGILGFGTVGRGTYEIIKNKPTKYFENIEVIKILIRTSKDEKLNILTLNPEDIINNKEIDLVVEAMGGTDEAYEYIIKALKNKKHVVTANKAVVSKNLKEFTELAYKNGVSFEYEASVCGGIPFIKSLEKIKRVDEISKIYGIFNGTSNYILDNMTKHNYEFEDILKKAQEIGYAESDPSDDIDGIDILRKLAITSSLAFETIISEDMIDVFGIRNINKEDIDYFKKIGCTVKLVAIGLKKAGKYCGSIEPVLFNNKELEASVPENFNIGAIVGETVGELKFYGQGAGKLPTGNAIAQDIIDISMEKEITPKVFDKKIEIDHSLIKGKYYVRVLDEIFKNEEIVEKELGEGIFITKEISSNEMRVTSKKYQGIFYAKLESTENI